MEEVRKVWYCPNKLEAYGDEEIEAVTHCLKDGWLSGWGPRTVEFEKRISERFNKKYGLFVNSGSSACLLALCAIDLKPGDEVITQACGFSTTVAPIIQLGGTPVFCDVMEGGHYVTNVEILQKAVTPKTRAIMIPNLLGNAPDWKSIRESFPNIILIEDSADTLPSSWHEHNGFSDISIVSFYSSHVMTAAGGGGMVMFNSEDWLKKATSYRDWGRSGDNEEATEDRFTFKIDGIPYDQKHLFPVLGYNLKSCEMNAAFGLVQLSKLDTMLAHRRLLVERYIENLKDCPHYVMPDDSRKPNWYAIPFLCRNLDRMKLVEYLENNQVQVRLIFAGNMTRHPAFRQYLGDFPVSDFIMKNGFQVGAHHGMSIKDVDRVCYLLLNFAKLFGYV
jgi:CDP-4-dehydro-6-deoxyglucose reductase, E1